MTYSDAYRQAVNAKETGENLCILMTGEHPDLLEPIRINNSGRNLESRGNTFLACFIEAVIIDQDPDRIPQAKLTVSNIKREMVVALRSTNIPCLWTIEIIRWSEPDYVEESYSNLELRNINYDEMVIQGDLIPRRLRKRKAVDYYFTPTTAPGLFAG